jgi:hypothetical protein
VPKRKSDDYGARRTNAIRELQAVRDRDGRNSISLNCAGDQTGRQIAGASSGNKQNGVDLLLSKKTYKHGRGLEFEASLFFGFDVPHQANCYGVKGMDHLLLGKFV